MWRGSALGKAAAMNNFIFERRYRKHVWRWQITDEGGKPVLSVWPWFTSEDGELFPCSPRHGGGLQIPLECLSDLRDAIDRAIDGINSRARD